MENRTEPPWPALLRIRPSRLLVGVAVFAATAWVVFLAVDIVGVAGIGERLPKPMWTYLFNDHLVEVSQWFILALLVLAAGYLAGRLTGRDAGAATFFFLLGIGLGLMLIEDAGDLRHAISGAVRLHLGDEVLGLPYRVVSDVPYFAALAAVPLYAVLRYGRYVWHVPATRRYLVTAVGLYAAASIGSGLRYLGGFYRALGRAIDTHLFGGRFPVPPDFDQERAHLHLVDGPIEETVELFAVTCLFAVALAYAAHLRAGRAAVPAPRRPDDSPAAVASTG